MMPPFNVFSESRNPAPSFLLAALNEQIWRRQPARALKMWGQPPSAVRPAQPRFWELTSFFYALDASRRSKPTDSVRTLETAKLLLDDDT
jgi:hypothetical protein